MRYTGPKVRRSRRAGVPLTAKAERVMVRRPLPPGQHAAGPRAGKQSDYGRQLAEKQKIRWYYDLSERQLRTLFDKNRRRSGRAGENVIAALESRLATVVLRAGLAPSIYAARQFVNHGHVTVDGAKVDIPSYAVRPGQVVAVRAKSRLMPAFQAAAAGQYADERSAAYLDVRRDELAVTLTREPKRAEVPVPFDEQLLVEFYSR
ncbi:30S ribosomal protein S4 [Catenulispora rubra]|uniref:30S ribosomal protein S4 n=1 Tax=Catenulispora rubra TaxID=280293 RepID=UPI0018928087|nr:30S ribosomal protein S4 [Catenulispora rubra]